MNDRFSGSSNDLQRDLSAVGIAPGDLVLLHTPGNDQGWGAADCDVLVKACLAAIGPTGTLVAPTMIPVNKGIRGRFNRETTPSEMGPLSEAVRTWPGAKRSSHKTHSLAAIGPLSNEICESATRPHGPITPWGTDAIGYATSWERLLERKAKILFVGVGFECCTLFQHVQVRYLDQVSGTTRRTPWPSVSFTKIGAFLDRRAMVVRGTLGEVQCMVVRSAEAVETALRELGDHPELYFDRSENLEWLETCREIDQQGRPTASAFTIETTITDGEKEVGRPMHLRGLIIQHPTDGGTVLMIWDQGYVLEINAAVIRSAVAEATGVEPQRVFLTATHTHSIEWYPSFPRPVYVAEIAERAARAAQEAARHMEPVRIGWASAQAPGINRNRTVFLKDGRAYTERWFLPSSWHVPEADIAGRGPTDEEIRLLVAERLDGSRLAVWANFSCHNSAAMDDPRVNDDFFGVAMELVEQAVGNGCTALITPGSEGDQDPTALVELGGVRDMAYARKLGERLAGYILASIADVPVYESVAMAGHTAHISLPVRDDWRPLAATYNNPELDKAAAEGCVHAEVSGVAIGEFAILGIPAEFFTSPALRIRSHSPFEITCVMALTNGNVRYVPESEHYFEGSIVYGTDTSFACTVSPGADRAFVASGIDVLREARRNQRRPT